MKDKMKKTSVKYTTMYPTSLVVNGLDTFGFELAKSLSEQGGYVIIVDNLEKEHDFPEFATLKNTAFLDYEGIADMVDDMRRLDYVFYLNHNNFDTESQLGSQEFLAASSYLNQILNLSVDFDALFLLTNSVKAHRYLLSMERYTERFVQDNVSDVAYSAAEFVRYSENLVTEFYKSRGLKSKIVRLGELLGEGIELSKKTNVGKLVWQAINGEDLYLDQDGLDSEYYVHILDAVYGVLKAQFTKESDDYIYTLAYPEPFTQLSLAYKIQEFELEAGDIKFVDAEDSKVRLSYAVYKAAKNLHSIGWNPKIDFDTALIQSIAFAKQIRQDLEEKIKNERTPVAGEDFATEIKNTALLKLIQERKQQEEKNMKKYRQGVDRMVERKRNVPQGTKFRRSIIKRYDKFKQNFKFLQDLTLFEAGIYLMLLSLFIFIFVTLLAPLTAMTRDFILLDKYMQDSIVAAQSHEWDTAEEDAKKAHGRVESIEQTAENANVLFAITGRDSFREDLLALMQSLGFYADAMENFSRSAKGSEEYYKAIGGDLVYRPTNSSVLSITESSDNSINETDISTLQSQNEVAKRSLDTAAKIYEQVNEGQLPKLLKSFGDELYANQTLMSDQISRNSKGLALADKIDRDSYTVGFVVKDNLRPTFSGGKVASAGVLEFSNGRLTDVRLLPIQNVDFEVSSLSEDEIVAIRAVSRGTQSTSDGSSAQDVLDYALINENYDSILRKSLSKSFDKEIDDVMSFDTIMFEDLLNTYGDIEINGRNFTSGNYLEQINVLQEGSINNRNRIITNITAVLFTKFFSQETGTLAGKQDILANLYASNKIILSPNLLETLADSSAENDDIFLSAYTLKEGDFTENPQIDMNMAGQIGSDNFTNEVSLSNVNSDSIDEVLFCVAGSGVSFDTSDMAIEDYTKVSTNDNTCLLISFAERNKQAFSYEKSYTGNVYQGEVAFPPGLGVRYDIEVNYPSNFLLTETVPKANKSANAVFYSGESFNIVKYELRFN